MLATKGAVNKAGFCEPIRRPFSMKMELVNESSSGNRHFLAAVLVLIRLHHRMLVYLLRKVLNM